MTREQLKKEFDSLCTFRSYLDSQISALMGVADRLVRNAGIVKFIPANKSVEYGGPTFLDYARRNAVATVEVDPEGPDGTFQKMSVTALSYDENADEVMVEGVVLGKKDIVFVKVALTQVLEEYFNVHQITAFLMKYAPDGAFVDEFNGESAADAEMEGTGTGDE